MAKFRAEASPEQQANSAIQRIEASDSISSVRTLSNYQERLEQIAGNLATYEMGCSIYQLTPKLAETYLERRSEEVGQKTLDMERQALQADMRSTGVLGQKETMRVVKSTLPEKLESRAYTKEQVQCVADHQRASHSLSTELAYATGIRAHELHTIGRPSEQPASERRLARDDKFIGRTGVKYTVVGKGGLVREVMFPQHLAERLEDRRLDSPRAVNDRGVYYQSMYEISGGKKWSDSYSKASSRAHGWSRGGHGLRHSYAQERMTELKYEGVNRGDALEIVSQELGHFRAEITEVYLR